MCMSLNLSCNSCSWSFIPILHAIYKQVVHAISVRRVLPLYMLMILSSNSCSWMFIPILHTIYKQIVHAISVRRVLCTMYHPLFQSFNCLFTSILRRTEVAWTNCLLARSHYLMSICWCICLLATLLSVRLSVCLLDHLRVHPFNSVHSFVCLSVRVFVQS